jgi:hypothetical protein
LPPGFWPAFFDLAADSAPFGGESQRLRTASMKLAQCASGM